MHEKYTFVWVKALRTCRLFVTIAEAERAYETLKGIIIKPSDTLRLTSLLFPRWCQFWPLGATGARPSFTSCMMGKALNARLRSLYLSIIDSSEGKWPDQSYILRRSIQERYLGGTVRAGTHNFANINYNFFPLGWCEGVWGIWGQAIWRRNYWSFGFLGFQEAHL